MAPVARLGCFALAALALLASACAPATGRAVPAAPQTPPDVVFVIPRGTAAAQMSGDPDAFRLPSEIDVVTGQRIVVRNEDQAMHYFFYLPIAPGQEVAKSFDEPGQFGYMAIYSCSIGNGPESLSVHVAPRGGAK